MGSQFTKRSSKSGIQFPHLCKHLSCILLSSIIIMPQLSEAQYGKDNIRVCKVHKNEETGMQTVVEMTVCVLLKGDIETS